MGIRKFLSISFNRIHLCTYANRKDPLVVYQFEEITTALEAERVANDSAGWTTLFRTKGNLRRMRILIAIAFFSQVCPFLLEFIRRSRAEE